MDGKKNHSLTYTFWASILGAEPLPPSSSCNPTFALPLVLSQSTRSEIHYFRPFLKILLQAHETNQLQQLFLKDIKENLQYLHVHEHPIS